METEGIGGNGTRGEGKEMECREEKEKRQKWKEGGKGCAPFFKFLHLTWYAFAPWYFLCFRTTMSSGNVTDVGLSKES